MEFTVQLSSWSFRLCGRLPITSSGRCISELSPQRCPGDGWRLLSEVVVRMNVHFFTRSCIRRKWVKIATKDNESSFWRRFTVWRNGHFNSVLKAHCAPVACWDTKCGTPKLTTIENMETNQIPHMDKWGVLGDYPVCGMKNDSSSLSHWPKVLLYACIMMVSIT